jgi:hypothetical protein
MIPRDDQLGGGQQLATHLLKAFDIDYTWKITGTPEVPANCRDEVRLPLF